MHRTCVMLFFIVYTLWVCVCLLWKTHAPHACHFDDGDFSLKIPFGPGAQMMMNAHLAVERLPQPVGPAGDKLTSTQSTHTLAHTVQSSNYQTRMRADVRAHVCWLYVDIMREESVEHGVLIWRNLSRAKLISEEPNAVLLQPDGFNAHVISACGFNSLRRRRHTHSTLVWPSVFLMLSFLTMSINMHISTLIK